MLCIIALATTLHAENLFENGDMDTSGGWKGTKKIGPEEDGAPAVKPSKPDKDGKEEKVNRVLTLTAKKNDALSFSQEISTKDLTDVVVKFRYRTKDYAGRGLEVRGKRANGGATFMNYPLKADGQWHEISWKFTQIQGSRKMDFVFALLEGAGTVVFDDFTAEPPK
jgi:hypothetical protein